MPGGADGGVIACAAAAPAAIHAEVDCSACSFRHARSLDPADEDAEELRDELVEEWLGIAACRSGVFPARGQWVTTAEPSG